MQWRSKGKMHKKVELGIPLSIATDQYHLIVDFELIPEFKNIHFKSIA